MEKLISIIIRTRNEERWINPCLREIFNQTYNNIEVIIVHNNSTDNTLKIAKKYNCKIVEVIRFKPGYAINEGIRNSSGKFLVCISAHCIPFDKNWLENLVKEFDTELDVAGVYGRQIPFSFTNPSDKRDLYNLFGKERKVQINDDFFHNANSIIKREIWEKFPFNEQTLNIEDRIWANKIISKKFKIIYTPNAIVYHWHGVNHYGNRKRAENISRLLDDISIDDSTINHLDPKKQNIISVIPNRKNLKKDNSKVYKSIKLTIEQVNFSKFINRVFLFSDDQDLIKEINLNMEVGILSRPSALSYDYVDLLDVVKKFNEIFELKENITDTIILMTETYSDIRNKKIIDKIINYHYKNGNEITFVGREEKRGAILDNNGELSIIGDGFMPNKFKSNKLIIGLLGYCTIIESHILRSGDYFRSKVGYYKI